MNQILERHALDDEVVSDSGRIDLKKLARSLDLTMPELAPILGSKPRSLNAHPTAKRPQEAAIKLVQMINDLSETLQERRFALYWLRTPQAELGDETPLDWLRKGKIDDVRSYAAALTRMQPD